MSILSMFVMVTQVHAQNQQKQMMGKNDMGHMDMNNMAMSEMKYPQKAEDISPLLIGEKIPMAMLVDPSGKTVDLNKTVAEKPTILIFYRGGWCPYCSKQLSGLQEISGDLENMGYQLIAIGTDAPAGLKSSMDKEGLKYTLLSDADLAVSKQFGIAFKAPKGYWDLLPKSTAGKNVDLLLPVPSVFILSKSGEINFEYINPDFTKRLKPALLKAVAQALVKDL